MAIKKKKSKKKKKSAAAADKNDEDKLKPQNEPPRFVDPVLDAPVAKIGCQLANPNHGLIKMEFNMKVSNKLYSLQ